MLSFTEQANGKTVPYTRNSCTLPLRTSAFPAHAWLRVRLQQLVHVSDDAVLYTDWKLEPAYVAFAGECRQGCLSVRDNLHVHVHLPSSTRRHRADS